MAGWCVSCGTGSGVCNRVWSCATEFYSEALARSEDGVSPSGIDLPGANWRALQPRALGARVRDLAWLAAMNRLPVRERTHRLGGPLGCSQVETIDHALWVCPEVALVLSLVSVWLGPAQAGLLTTDLVVRGVGLGRLCRRRRWMLWVVACECKSLLWERQMASLRLSAPPLGSPQDMLARVKWAVWGYIRACGRDRVRQEALRIWGHLARAVPL